MSIERAKADLRKRLSEVKDEAVRLEKALVALGGAAVPVGKFYGKKAVRSVKRWSAAANAKRAAALKKYWANKKKAKATKKS